MPFPKGKDGKPTRATALAWAKAIQKVAGDPPYEVHQDLTAEQDDMDAYYEAVAELLSDFVSNWKPYLVDEKPK